MELNALYDIAEKENIKIYNWQIEDVNGLYLNYHNINAIALNYDNLGKKKKKKCTLAEELGHSFANSCYPASCTDKILIDKQEYRAKGFSYKLLIPIERLRTAISYRI